MRTKFSVVTILATGMVAGSAWAGEGKLDKEIIRKVVQAHITEVRWCYMAGLARNAELAGRFVVDFEIAATGEVSRAEIRESTLADAQVTACVAEAVRQWKFPRPEGGAVSVMYPFVLEPG